MIRALRRILSGALSPPPVRSIPTDEQLADALGLKRVETFTNPEWDDFQASTTAEIEAARAKHAPVRHLEERRTKRLHDALASLVPTEGQAPARSRVAS